MMSDEVVCMPRGNKLVFEGVDSTLTEKREE
jgi:hypothetical protein